MSFKYVLDTEHSRAGVVKTNYWVDDGEGSRDHPFNPLYTSQQIMGQVTSNSSERKG